MAGRIYRTRETMSEELKRELELIENDERDLALKEMLAEEIDSSMAFLRSNFSTFKCDQQERPFGIEFYIEGIGVVASGDLRNELLERFSDDPEEFKELIVAASKAMRDFADELDLLAKNAG